MSENNLTLPQKLLNVQTRIGAVTKSSSNPHFKSKYADLNEVLSVAKEALNAERLVLVQGPGLDQHGRYIETTIIDADSGQSLHCRVPFSGSEDNMQKIGAATTYGRRFGILSLLALESEDDDGETAVGRSYESRSTKSVGGYAAPKKEASGGSPGPVIRAKEVSPPQPRGPVASKSDVYQKISLTSKVLVDSKRATETEVMALLTAYGVKAKEELNEEQANKLLVQLEGKLNE